MADAMSPAIAQLEAQLRRDPEHEDAWRIYADHLLDQGDRRGELITLSALQRTHRDAAVRKSIAALDEALRSESPDLQQHPSVCRWKHGFPIQLTYSIDAPRDITSLGRLLADPRMRLCGSATLFFHHNLRARFYEGFAKIDLAPLTTLVAGRTRRGNALARGLAANPTLRLDVLRLDDTDIGDAGVAALARSESLRGLSRLSLRHAALHEKGLSALLDSPLAETIEVLDLHYIRIDEAMARALANASLGRLRSLGLYVHQFSSNDAVRTLAASSTLPPDIVRFWRGVGT